MINRRYKRTTGAGQFAAYIEGTAVLLHLKKLWDRVDERGFKEFKVWY
jgi:hypothetical protein